MFRPLLVFVVRLGSVAFAAALMLAFPAAAQQLTGPPQILPGNPDAPNGLNIAGIGVAQGPAVQLVADATLGESPNVTWHGPYLQDGSLLPTTITPVRTVTDLVTMAPQAVSGTASGLGGAIKITVASTTGWTTGDWVQCNSIGGTTEANQLNTMTVNDATHITLAGTTFVNTYTSGGTCGDTKVTSATANFSESGDDLRPLYEANVPLGAYIVTTQNNSNTAFLSLAPTAAGSGGHAQIGADCHGLPEMIAYANEHGFSWQVNGRGTVDFYGGQSNAQLNCNAPLGIPVSRMSTADIHGVLLNIDPSTVSTATGVSNYDGITFDSSTHYAWNSEGTAIILLTGGGAAVRIKPTNWVPQEAFKGIVGSSYHFGVVDSRGTGPGMVLDASNAGINAPITTTEVGSGGSTAFQTIGGGGPVTVVASLPHVLSSGAGDTIIDGAGLGSVYDVGSVEPIGGTNALHITAATRSNWRIGAIADAGGTSVTTGVLLDGATQGTIVNVGVNAASTGCSDTGSGNYVWSGGKLCEADGGIYSMSDTSGDSLAVTDSGMNYQHNPLAHTCTVSGILVWPGSGTPTHNVTLGPLPCAGNATAGTNEGLPVLNTTGTATYAFVTGTTMTLLNSGLGAITNSSMIGQQIRFTITYNTP